MIKKDTVWVQGGVAKSAFAFITVSNGVNAHGNMMFEFFLASHWLHKIN